MVLGQKTGTKLKTKNVSYSTTYYTHGIKYTNHLDNILIKQGVPEKTYIFSQHNEASRTIN
jgi:Rps23 Pro-64 3,4-dihydroxylase Tpa1-like proline 4-hydroxylase